MMGNSQVHTNAGSSIDHSASNMQQHLNGVQTMDNIIFDDGGMTRSKTTKRRKGSKSINRDRRYKGSNRTARQQDTIAAYADGSAGNRNTGKSQVNSLCDV